ncbi:hypothetical protein [Spirosoma terrae]|uniref:YfhO family protein n=1 Tax=Spirosoma terrae TaxID=1968276 RepID=A0A6L9LAN1_9BACT|nr:hypothetical protein [Spirosoma terrae]NDU96557.1 hypothetical protein [Spirosoma terrae]
MRTNTIGYVLLFLLTAGLASLAVGDFTMPMSDGNDTDQYEYVGYFFWKNVTLWPFPQLKLINTQTFYPYGTNQVFLDWGFERDYWYAICYWLFGGAGPYLQFYYVYSLVLTAIGTFALMSPRFGRVKAFVLALVVSVFNFYAIWKFPVHMNVCINHWTVLCMVATYRLLLDVVARKAVSLAYIVFWVWLHVQVLGQELAYVAGFALTLTTLTIPVLMVLLYRQFPVVREWPALIRRYVSSQYQSRKRLILGLLALIAISAWLYLPLTLQIAFTAWEFDFASVPELRAWSHPLRLFIPHLPSLNTYSVDYQSYFRDTFESYAQGSPGLYLVVLAVVGWWQIRRRVALWLPLVVMLILCLIYHPVLVPTLKIFPWFSFNRHGGRASLVYPVLLSLLALNVSWPRYRIGQAMVGLLVVLMGLEWYFGFYQKPQMPDKAVSRSVLQYCSIVKKQSGEAVLDWPFCVVGADGVGDKEGLCPYYEQQNANFTFRRFYNKSVVGQYFGRLHPDQIQPFLRDGWPRLLTPNRDFSEQDWQFLHSFLRKNDFAGINLYLDLLTPSQIAGFYRHFGQPIAQTRFPATGRVVFIPLQSAAKKSI